LVQEEIAGAALMAIPIIKDWKIYFSQPDEGLGSSYERIVLNNKIQQICKHFEVEKILEAPNFGFTGLSGINSMQLGVDGKDVTIMDHEEERLNLIHKVWQNLNIPLQTELSKDYNNLPFDDNSFDFSWNFSALWFTEDLTKFLTELTRVTSKAILLCVPNRSGIGYLSQKYLGKDDLKKYLKEEHILPKNIKNKMKELDWSLIDSKFIDCPPWPDIGMPKEKFLRIFGLQWLLKEEKNKDPLTILDYYSDKNPDFASEMMEYFWLEKKLPEFLKKFWAHHRYFLFIPNKR